MRLLPRSLAGQTVLVLLLGLTVSHLVSMLTFSHERADAVGAMNARGAAARMVEVTHLIEATGPEARDSLVKAANGAGLSVATEPKAMLAGDAGGGDATTIRRYLQQELGRPVAVRLVDPGRAEPHDHPGMSLGELPAGHVLDVAVPLADATLRFRAAVPPRHDLWSWNALASMALMTAGVLLAAFWAVRRLTTPLATFAEAADRLGKDVQAPPLPVAGPTELRQAALAFNRMQARLRRLLENRTQMMAAISHDLRTPITLLRLRAEFVEDEGERAKMLATLDEMETLIASTLAFASSEAEAEPRRTVDVAALLCSICDDLSDAGADVTCETPAKLSYACRPLALKRAFINLIDNAVKYGERARVAMSATSERITVTVDDDGLGIPEEELARVFMPFYRVDKSRRRETGGVGLGLAVTQATVDAHGGRVTLSNRAEGGLRAVVELPR